LLYSGAQEGGGTAAVEAVAGDGFLARRFAIAALLLWTIALAAAPSLLGLLLLIGLLR
jgi:hypothetical protein